MAPLPFTEPESLSQGKIAGLFSSLFRIKAQERVSENKPSLATGVNEDERREALTELAAEWYEQELYMLFEPLCAAQDMHFGGTIKARLLSLREMLKEEEGESTEFSLESLRAFIAFLLRLSDVRLPSLTLTSEGEIYARWKGEGGRLFAAHFICGEKVRFVAFRPNPRRPRLVQRISGVDAVDTVLGIADNACSVLEWMRQ